jgi:heat shock protein HslJ
MAEALAETPAAGEFLPSSSGSFVEGLPASYTCADCGGIRYHLNLLADHSFFLRRTDLRSGGDGVDDIGTWALTRGRSIVVLSGGGRTIEQLTVGDNQDLRRPGSGGGLTRTESFEPLEMRLTLRGVFSSSAGTRSFVECLTGQPWSVAASPDLDARYQAARPSAGGSVLAAVEGRVVTELSSGRVVPRLAVERVVDVQVADTCTPRGASRSLARTAWTLTELFGQRVSSTEAVQRAGLEFDESDFNASDGCNRLLGSYRQDGARLTFSVSISAREACPGAAEGESFKAALDRVRSWRVLGETLALLDADGILVARFEAR